MRTTLWRAAGAAVVAVAVAVAVSATTGASGAIGRLVSTDPANFTPNVNEGAVHKMFEYSGVLYAGGSFSSVTAAPGTSPAGTFARSNLVAFNSTTGSVSTTFAPAINGEVWAIVATSGWLYVGGNFTTVNGVARRGLAKLNPITGALDTRFNAALTDNVTEAAVVGGRLIISGRFAKRLQAVSLASGADTGYINAKISGSLAVNSGPTEVYRFAVNPAGTRLVAIGSFTSAGGASRPRAFMLDLGTTATLSPWSYAPLRNLCSVTTIPAYLRDVDFAPDGNWFALVATGGIAPTGTVGTAVCDAAARFETWNLAPVRPTWINYTGGDTLHSVAATDKGVYVQGHQRWLDNPLGKDNAGPGAVSREGIGAINNSTGKALDWNPTKDRGIGGKDLLITARGLWVGSDTQRIGNELHARLALLP